MGLNWFTVLVSGVQQSDSVIHVHISIFFKFFSHLGYYRIFEQSSLCYIVVPSVQFTHSVVSNSLWPHGLRHARLPCPSPTPRACSNSCTSSRWCYSTVSSSVVPFSCLQSFSESGPFPMSQFFASGGQSIGASASVLPMNIQDWFPLGLTGWISLQSKGLSRVFSNTTVQKHHSLALSFLYGPTLISIHD